MATLLGLILRRPADLQSLGHALASDVELRRRFDFLADDDMVQINEKNGNCVAVIESWQPSLDKQLEEFLRGVRLDRADVVFFLARVPNWRAGIPAIIRVVDRDGAWVYPDDGSELIPGRQFADRYRPTGEEN